MKNAKRVFFLLAVLLLAVIAGVVTSSKRESLPSPGDRDQFAGTRSIVLTGERLQKTVVSTEDQVAALVAAISLEPKEACACKHRAQAIFKTDDAEIRVSLCDHCFNIVGGEETKYYKMNKPFYELFQSRIPSAEAE